MVSGVRVWRGEWCEGVRVVSGVRVWRGEWCEGVDG